MKTFDMFHDGFLDGLLVHGSILHVFLSTSDKQEFVLQVSGVLSLKVDGFRQGNIIYDVLVRAGDEVTFDDIMNFYEFKDETKALLKLEDARKKNVVVLEINPSYGATCILLAKSVDLLHRQEWANRVFATVAQ